MTPGIYNLTLYRGDTYEWTINLWEDTAQTVEVDLAGASVAAQWRDRPDGTAVLEFDLDVDLPNTINMAMTPSLWSGAPSGGVWDLQITESGGRVMTVLRGAVSVTLDVTLT